MLLLALPAGVLTGLVMGALGAGGSILAIPILVYLLGQSPHQASTTSLIIVGIAACAGALAHHRAGRVRLNIGVVFGVVGIAGSTVGSLASATVNPHLLMLGLAALMLAAAAAMLARRRTPDPPPRSDLPATAGTAITLAERRTAHATATVLATATAVGLVTGLFGVGGGFVVVPALVLALRLDTATAVGTSLIVIAINSATALATRIATTPVTLDWVLLAAFSTATLTGVLLGNTVATRLDHRRLTVAFAILLVLLAGYTAATNAAHL